MTHRRSPPIVRRQTAARPLAAAIRAPSDRHHDSSPSERLPELIAAPRSQPDGEKEEHRPGASDDEADGKNAERRAGQHERCGGGGCRSGSARCGGLLGEGARHEGGLGDGEGVAERGALVGAQRGDEDLGREGGHEGVSVAR